MTRSPAIVLLLLAACAGPQKKGTERLRQADHGLPAATAFAEGPVRDAYAAAHAHEAKGDATATSSIEQARADWAAAAEGYATLATNPVAADWQIPLRHRAAELFLRAQRFDRAQEAAAALAADPEASEGSKVVAARLDATAALGAASAAVKAGQLDRLELGGAAARKDAAARTPPAPWKRVVDAVDAYLARAAADPEMRNAAGERRVGISPAELALVAAEVQFSYGNLDGARARLESLHDRWPSDAEVLEQAVPLYLATFAARDDRAGHDAAVERLRARIGADAAKAAPKEKAAFARVLEGLGRARAGSRFATAEKILADGKPAEAAQAFEAVALDPAVGEPANALHNAAVAWEKAGDHGRAAAVRERIVKQYATSQVAPGDALALAAHRSRTGDHLGSARAYEDFLQRWPDSPSRCLALRNAASELDVANRAPEAAMRYLAFGRDEACAKADPAIAARALSRAGMLFEAQARSAYTAANALSGVPDENAQPKPAKSRKRRRGH